VITFILKVLVFSSLAVLLAWGVVLVKNSPAADPLAEEISRLRATIPDRTFLREYEAKSLRAASIPDRFLPPLPRGNLLPRLRHLAGVAGLRLAVSLEILPVLVPLAFTGIALGLAVRERSRAGRRHSSPTQAWFGKHLVVAALATLALFALTPLTLPYFTPWISAAALSIGGSVYVANLPVKL
jgi:hypothetical protein